MKNIGVFFLGFATALLVIIIVVIIMVFVNPRFNNTMRSYFNKYEAGYEYAEFDKFNSDAKSNGLDGTAVYIHSAKVISNEYNSDMLSASNFISTTDEGNWLIMTGIMNNVSGINDAIKSASDIWVYGVYLGYSSVKDAPAILATQIIIDNKIYSLNSTIFE